MFNVQISNRQFACVERACKPLLVAVALLLQGCGGSTTGSANNAPLDTIEPGLLQPVASEAQFVEALSAGIESSLQQSVQQDERLQVGAPIPGSTLAALFDASTQSADTSFTTTYTLEAEVDEYDIVKYDGDHLYIASSRRNFCCTLLPLRDSPVLALDSGTDALDTPIEPQAELVDQSFAPEYELPPGVIRILATDSDNASASEVATITLPEPAYVQGMYRFGEQLAVLSTQNFFASYGRAFFDIYAWYEQSITLDLYSVTDPQAHELKHHIKIQGGLVESRRIGDTIYVISRHTPRHPLLKPLGLPVAVEEGGELSGTPEQEPVSSSELIPKLTVNEEQMDLFAPTDCFVANDKLDTYDRPGYAVVTSITAIPVHNPLAMKTLCYNESAAGVYVAENSIYLTDVRYADRAETVVHKFSLTDIAPEYRGSAIVPGHIWSGGQLDFRLNEFRGQLRVVTTEFTGIQEDRMEHRLFILQESAGEQALEIVAELPNELRPESIGKPNESLYGVRFFGERAYLVTFEQIDPLYVLDLSDASDPKIAGELEVPGFSDFLHPVNNNLLLGLGQDGTRDRRVKLELFDISDMSNPLSRDIKLIGEEGSNSWSEALYNRHAFTYQHIESASHHFAVPANINGYDEIGVYTSQTSLQLFEINNLLDPANASLDYAGAIVANPRPELAYWWPGQPRSVFDGDAVFFITGDYVWSALWDTPSQQAGPQ